MIKRIEQPIKTKYIYRQMAFFNGEPSFSDSIKLDCEIIAESDTQYKIRILRENMYFLKGREMWVKKKNTEYGEQKTNREYDYSQAYWNK